VPIAAAYFVPLSHDPTSGCRNTHNGKMRSRMKDNDETEAAVCYGALR
jgi:hypothetical protein